MDFQEMIATEKARVAKEREKLLGKRAEVDEQLLQLDRDMLAIDAYEAAKAGKLPGAAKSTGKRTRRAGRRDAVLEVIKNNPGGIGRADIINAMGASGEKKEEQSISNALAALKKLGMVDARNRKYHAK